MALRKAERTPDRLRLEAYYARLDNRVAQARKYNREADALEAAVAHAKR